MPLRVAMPNKVIKPIIDGILIMLEVKNTANTPPIKANGKLSNTIADNVRFLNSINSNRKIIQIANIEAILGSLKIKDSL